MVTHCLNVVEGMYSLRSEKRKEVTRIATPSMQPERRRTSSIKILTSYTARSIPAYGMMPNKFGT